MRLSRAFIELRPARKFKFFYLYIAVFERVRGALLDAARILQKAEPIWAYAHALCVLFCRIVVLKLRSTTAHTQFDVNFVILYAFEYRVWTTENTFAAIQNEISIRALSQALSRLVFVYDEELHVLRAHARTFK